VTQNRPLTSLSDTGISRGRFAAMSLPALTHPTFGRSSNAFVYGIALHSASSAPAQALSDGAA
jgi:hypothetical protein